MQHHTYTTEFQHEFAAATRSLLRRRFLWFTGVMAGLTLAFLLTMALRPARGADTLPPPRPQVGPSPAAAPMPGDEAAAPEGQPPPGANPRPFKRPGGPSLVRDIARDISAPPSSYDVVITALRTLSFAVFFVIAVRTPLRDRTVLQLTFAAVMIDGALLIAARFYDATGGMGIAAVTLSHMMACCFLPWTPKQAVSPMVPLLVLNAAVLLVLPEQGWVKTLGVAVSPLFALPGTAICWLRHTRRLASFKVRFLESRLGSLREELIAARRVHEAMFPRPEGRGHIRFDYRYVPMRLIGGDYLHVRFGTPMVGATPHALPFSMLLLDVTGHGIPAALTVNRLFGELERLHAESPEIRPGPVLAALNRYIHLTLSDHSLFVTALAVRIDPSAGAIEYANAGHPPAFIRGVDGSIDQLDSTTCVLGVFDHKEFEAAPRLKRFGPGDALIAYTDGAMETKNSSGRMLGVDGLRASLLSTPPDKSYATALMASVDAHRHGAPADDTLIVEVFHEIVPQSFISKPMSISTRQSGIFSLLSGAAPQRPTQATAPVSAPASAAPVR